MASNSEYGALRKVILGTIEDYRPACWGWKEDPGVNERNFYRAIEFCESSLPNQIRDEVLQDLADYEDSLKSLGVEVLRPPRILKSPVYETEFLYAYGRDFYNMRDLHIVFGKTIVSSAPSQPNRILEIFELREFFEDISKNSSFQILPAPNPNLKANPVYPNVRDIQGNLVSLEDARASALGSITQEIWHRLKEEEVLFDAANVIRFQGNALYLVSSTGNQKAFNWLNSLGLDFVFHQTDVYRSSHIDSTILPLGKDTFLVNSIRVNPGNLPSCMKNSKILYFEDVVRIPENEILFHKDFRSTAGRNIEKLGFHTNLTEMSSPWAGMNVVSINEDTVMVESNQTPLIEFLESNGYDVVPVRMRHAYTMLGGLHCTTLDLVRDNG